MMYLLASDFDGTLCRNGEVTQTDSGAVKRFREEGNLFGIITGRNSTAYEVFCETGVEFDFVLVLNGAMALDKDKNIIFDYRVFNNNGIIKKITDIVSDFGGVLTASVGTSQYRFSSRADAVTDEILPAEEAKKITEFTMLTTRFDCRESVISAAGIIKKRFGDIVNTLPSGLSLDMPSADIDKGVGLSKYAEALGIEKRNIFTVGDDLNDVAMLKRFYGYCVYTARDEVKACSDKVCRSVACVIDDILKK